MNTTTQAPDVARPGWKDLTSGFPTIASSYRRVINKHWATAADEYKEGVSYSAVKRRDDEYNAAELDFIAALVVELRKARTITEADVVAWLADKCREVRERTKCTEASVSISNRVSVPAKDSDHAYFCAHAWGECEFGETMAEAIDKLASTSRRFTDALAPETVEAAT